MKEWCADSEILDAAGQRLCVGDEMVKKAAAVPRLKHAMALMLECAL